MFNLPLGSTIFVFNCQRSCFLMCLFTHFFECLALERFHQTVKIFDSSSNFPNQTLNTFEKMYFGNTFPIWKLILDFFTSYSSSSCRQRHKILQLTIFSRLSNVLMAKFRACWRIHVSKYLPNSKSYFDMFKVIQNVFFFSPHAKSVMALEVQFFLTV